MTEEQIEHTCTWSLSFHGINFMQLVLSSFSSELLQTTLGVSQRGEAGEQHGDGEGGAAASQMGQEELEAGRRQFAPFYREQGGARRGEGCTDVEMSREK